MKVHLTLKSTNKKTGPIPVSTTEESTCPRSCPWFRKGCYADQGPLRLHWKKVSEHSRGSSFTEFLAQIKKLDPGQLWRHNQAGDLPGSNTRINKRLLERLVSASQGRRGFTYTHKPVEGSSTTAKKNRSVIKEANTDGFTINLSANGIKHADKLMKLKIAPVTTVLPSDYDAKITGVRSFTTPKGNQVVICPATYEDISCSTCRMCAISTRKSIIAFPAHGSQVKKVNQALQILE